MSIGNLKDYGNKGNNFPFQLSVLKGLQSLLDILSGTTTGQVRTPNILNTSVAGTVPDAYSFSIANVGAASGTVGGQALPAGTSVNFDGGAVNNTLTGIAYDATGTTFIITWIS